MGIVQLDSHLVGQVLEGAVGGQVVLDDVADGGSRQEVLLAQAEDLALNVVVVGVQHLGDELSAGVLAHCGVVVAQREAGHIEVGSLGLPQTQLCNAFAVVTLNVHIRGDGHDAVVVDVLDIVEAMVPVLVDLAVEADFHSLIGVALEPDLTAGQINYMALIGDNQVRMANICAYTANSINGVSKLHSEIIKQSVFHDYYLFKPQAFKNVTNGIAYRRWLLASNPELCKLLDETIGTGYKHDAADLSKLNKFAEDKTVLKRLNEIKLDNKKNFAAYLEKSTGQVIDPNSIFDCQVKRMHEYKRQHLNALNIAAQYLYLKENPNADFIPKTYIFGAKAAPGYYMAKQMIRMICKLGDLINNDPAVREKLRVVYLEEYCVSLSEHLMPAAEVSEQISLAGTEASGTGNMKFMLNGAITLGTLDGANVEIADAAGKENELIFGMLTPEVNNLKQVGYHPNAFITGDDVANAALNFLERGWNGENFHEVTENLRSSDPYMVMADFKDYRRAQADLQRLYADREHWAKMSLKNIANSGIFSADRAVLDYARDIWHASAVK
jgi:glycogen phosphorylase